MSSTSTTVGYVLVAAGMLDPLAVAVALIFGGCCGSSYTLELITHTMSAGASVTLAQFLGTALITFLYNSLSLDGRASIYSPKVPLLEYAKLVACHFTISFLNNLVLDFHVTVPTHIILRSGGPVITMSLGWTIYNRKYTSRQVFAVYILTLGIIISTYTSRPQASSEPSQADIDASLRSYLIGLFLMVLATLLSSFMSLYLERTFRSYKPSWKESLFYTVGICLELCHLMLTVAVASFGLAALSAIHSSNAPRI